MAAKCIMLVADGMGDRPVPELGGLTPAEAANAPHLQRLAAEGICGLLAPIKPGVRAGSDTAHLALLGYDPYQTYTGRGPFEALGIGMEVRRGDICFRCNFATVDQHLVVLDRRAGRIASGTGELAQALNGMQLTGGVIALFKESVEHRAALILRGEGLGHQVSDADPHAESQPVHEVVGADPAGARTAAAVNEFVRRSHEILKDHPLNRQRQAQGLPTANIVLPRGAGVAPHLTPFQEKYGFSGAAVVEVGLIKGIARYLGMEVVEVAEATGGYDTDEQALGRAALAALGRHDFVLCNLKAPDLAGHDGDAMRKVATMGKVDNLAGVLLGGLPPETLLVCCADHSTPVAVRDHSGDEVPFLLWGPGVRTDAVAAFGERPMMAGGLGHLTGNDVMPVITNLMNRQEKFGA